MSFPPTSIRYAVAILGDRWRIRHPEASVMDHTRDIYEMNIHTWTRFYLPRRVMDMGKYIFLIVFFILLINLLEALPW